MPCSKLIVLFLFIISSCLAQEGTSTWNGDLRTKSIKGMDRLLTWALRQKTASYALVYPLEVQIFHNTLPELTEFERRHGFFSKEPLLGKVTKSEKNIDATVELLEIIYRKITDPAQFIFTTGEVIAEILAYRDLKEGMEIPIPFLDRQGKPAMAIYTVDRVFNLWHGMPAFGLVPKKPSDAVPILLYRGTDLSLYSIRSLASLASDLDWQGIGLSAFQNGQPSIHHWLQNNKARVIGFSLGGILTTYTLLYEKDLISTERLQPSLSFNQPGISQKNLQEWPHKFPNPPAYFTSYVTRGDFVSKVGYLVGAAFECAVNEHLTPIFAHNTFLSAQSTYYIYRIDTAAENQSRD